MISTVKGNSSRETSQREQQNVSHERFGCTKAGRLQKNI